MSVTVVIGAQWGDEGKAGVVDWLANNHMVGIRVQGGPDAGNTAVHEGQKFALHQFTPTILHAGSISMIGPLVVVEPKLVCKEIELGLAHRSVPMLDMHAPIVLPIHRVIDHAREVVSGDSKIGTTKRGVGPAMADFWLRRSLCVADFRSRAALHAALVRGNYWNELVGLCQQLGVGKSISFDELSLEIDPLSLDETLTYLDSCRELIAAHTADTRLYVYEMFHAGFPILAVNAHAMMLDRLTAAPYSVPTLCGPAAFTASYGINTFDRVIGIVKAYPSRVGEGPFPTQMSPDIEQWVRKAGNEYGATTGRPRKCGWLDMEALRFAARMGMMTELAVTKIDVLSGVPELNIATHYDNWTAHRTANTEALQNARPVYKSFEPWQQDLSSIREWTDLPSEAVTYLQYIQSSTGLPISLIKNGPETDAIMTYPDMR